MLALFALKLIQLMFSWLQQKGAFDFNVTNMLCCPSFWLVLLGCDEKCFGFVFTWL